MLGCNQLHYPLLIYNNSLALEVASRLRVRMSVHVNAVFTLIIYVCIDLIKYNGTVGLHGLQNSTR